MFTLKLKTAEKNLFKLYQKFINNNIKYSLFSLHKTKHFQSVIRSPHANKNSQEQFQLVYFKHILKIPKENNFKILKHSLIQDQSISGSIYETKKIKFTSFF
jgi:ribosomal protein S10